MARKSQAEVQLDAMGKGGKGKKDKKNKNKKYGRNLKKCARYKQEGRREKNKARKAARRLKNLR